ncbi:hypothetical protein BN871_AC_01300 [Paenibacillus sp. P22]|nr:hypothetical protein BN871_AC_01300 [Paenibacillus sp. P22]
MIRWISHRAMTLMRHSPQQPCFLFGGRLLAEPFLEDGRVRSVGLHIRQSLIQRRQKFRIVLAYGDPGGIGFDRFSDRLHLVPVLVHDRLQGVQIVDRGVDPAGIEVLEGGDDIVVGFDIELAYLGQHFIAQVGFIVRTEADADIFAFEILQLRNGVVAFADDDLHLVRNVRLSEVDLLLALVGYGHLADDDIDLACLQARNQAGEVLRREFRLHSKALGDILGDVCVEAVDFLVLVQEIIRRVGAHEPYFQHAGRLHLSEEVVVSFRWRVASGFAGRSRACGILGIVVRFRSASGQRKGEQHEDGYSEVKRFLPHWISLPILFLLWCPALTGSFRCRPVKCRAARKIRIWPSRTPAAPLSWSRSRSPARSSRTASAQ